jgi:hypothetical protein
MPSCLLLPTRYNFHRFSIMYCNFESINRLIHLLCQRLHDTITSPKPDCRACAEIAPVSALALTFHHFPYLRAHEYYLHLTCTTKHLGISIKACAECPMLHNKTLSIKPVNHTSPSCADDPNSSSHSPLQPMNCPLNKHLCHLARATALSTEPTLSLSIKHGYCFAICVYVQGFILRHKNLRSQP